jgi:phosphate-selective porin OprO/OprP
MAFLQAQAANAQSSPPAPASSPDGSLPSLPVTELRPMPASSGAAPTAPRRPAAAPTALAAATPTARVSATAARSAPAPSANRPPGAPRTTAIAVASRPPAAPTALAAATAASSAPTQANSREAELEQRLRKLEAMYEMMEKKHNDRYDALYKEFQALRSAQQNQVLPAPNAWPATPIPDDDRIPEGPEGTIGRGTDQPEPGDASGSGPAGTAGNRVGTGPEGNVIGRPNNAGGTEGRGPGGTVGRRGEEEKRSVLVSIANGLRFDSEDGEFQMQFHNLTQAELRNFPDVGNQSPLHTSFFIPRQRWYFVGRATKNVEFYTVINRGYSSLDLLDAFLNFNFDPRIQFRAGRTKTPTSYEYYQIAEGDLIAPERSLFIGNLAGNRQNGFMFHGRILKESSEWALGVFNGPRRSFQDFNSDKDLYMFYNIRPFQQVEALKDLHYFNIGGAYNFGTQHNPLQPNALNTANDQTSNYANTASLSPTFFKFNDNVIENGYRAQWAAWIMWFWRSFNVLAEYDGGFQDYAITNASTRVRVPMEGFSVTTFYFLTGERITRRVDVRPKSNFGFKDGKLTGTGAFEIFGRISTLNIGNDVFTGGLADHNLWSNQAYAIDTGVNWYWNPYTKIYMDWQHAVFGNPVYNGPYHLLKTSDLLWLRFQLFF